MRCNTNPKSDPELDSGRNPKFIPLDSSASNGARIQISKFKYYNKYSLFGWLIILLFNCDNHIIERAASDYFPYDEGNWWRYSDNAVYEPQIIFVEVESLVAILGVACYPVTFSGEVHYFAKGNKGINEYIEIVHNFSGEDYTIVQGFIKRIELPLIKGNVYQDSLYDSLSVSGIWLKAKYKISGVISEYQYEDLYGEVYKIWLTTTRNIILPDTTTTEENYVVEYYAPDIGLIRFANEQGEYNLSEYEVQ